MPCPHCNGTTQYTDPLLQVRCLTCFNHVNGIPTTPIGRVQDLEAPMTIHLANGATITYPNVISTR